MKLPSLNRKFIFYIALVSFVLLIVLQAVWLSNSYRLKENDFNEKVKSTLRFFNNDFQDNPVLGKNLRDLWDNHTTMPQIQPSIKYSIDTCFERNGLPTDYVYGLGVYKKKTFWSSDAAYAKEINESKFSIIALCMDKAGAYEMKIFFPNKQSYIISGLTPLLIFSGFSFLLLLFCFVSLIMMLKKEAKLSLMKNDFINNMTHELKTPLFTISIASKMLAEEYQENKDAKPAKYTQSIQQEAKRLNNLVEKILQVALLEKKEMNLDKKEMDIHAAIKMAVEGFEMIKLEKGGTTSLHLDAEIHHIEADETHIVNTIYNLLDNAFKYSDKEPHIIISTRNVGNKIIVSVKDNGIGFDAETKELIFERFYRAHTGNIHNVKGYGIGLSYVRSVVEAHNGLLTVNSNVNMGSEFTLQLPLTR
ncbi:MAG TPA: HAMP domain-containing sensor histidine kinase [Segetibacter sp.]|jgi:two-component system phosphate regulon sensor histidine kinase PhoR